MGNNGIHNLSLLANAKWDFLKSKYGDDPAAWKAAGALTLMGADVVEGYNTWANEKLQAAAMEKRQQEISARADISIQNLASESRKAQAVQETAFVKSGVKIEGSAIDVLTETALKAMEAAKVRRREADFEISTMETEKVLSRLKAKYTPLNTALSMGTTALMLGVD